jgi:hypothetical protein
MFDKRVRTYTKLSVYCLVFDLYYKVLIDLIKTYYYYPIKSMYGITYQLIYVSTFYTFIHHV